MNQQNENNQADGSHIDNIIGRLREVRDGGDTSVERSRDIIERADGTKVVKVRRRRRVYRDDKRDMEPSSSADFKKWMLIGGMALIFLCIVGIVFLMVRISSFNSAEFSKGKAAELSQAWGAEVDIQGLSFEGLSFSAGRVTAKFPESSLVKEAVLEGVSAKLIPISFITGICRGDMMTIRSAKVVLRNKVNKMVLPSYSGRKLWEYSRYQVQKFELVYENQKDAPFQLQTELYVRLLPDGGRFNCNLNSKTLNVRGWDPVSLTISSVYVSKEGLEYIDINGVMGESSTVSIKGSMKEGADLSLPSLTISTINLPLAMITRGTFSPLLTAELGSPTEDTEETRTSFKFSLPAVGQSFPAISGNAQDIKKIALKNLPILKELSNVTGNKGYLHPVIQSGKSRIESDGNGISFTSFEGSEFSFLTVKGDIRISDKKELSGKLSFGIPRRSAMQGDMIVDPLFVRDDGELVWVDVSLSGTLSKPTDNTEKLVNAVQKTREKNARARNMIQESSKPSEQNNIPNEDDDSLKLEEFKSLLK